MIPDDLERGDLIVFDWWDATEDPIGNPNNLRPAHRTTYALFWDRKQFNDMEYIVTTATIDKDVPDQQGACAYPLGMISSIKRLKRLKRKRKVKNEPQSTPST